MHMDFDLLRTFVAVVDAGGFTRAAERVHLTQSTVSLQIKKLEAGIGHPLLVRERTGGGVRTTEEGDILLGYARRLLAISAEAVEALQDPSAPKTVRLGVPEDFAGRRLIGLLSSFSRTFPDIRLDTQSGWSTGLWRLLDKGDTDLALIKREPGDGQCVASWAEELAWVGGPNSPVSQEPIPLALFPPGCIYRERAMRALDIVGVRWRIAYTSQGLMGVQAAVAGGLGISVLPLDAVLGEHRILSEECMPDLAASELALVTAERRPNQAVQTVADFLMDHVGKMMDRGDTKRG
ncbi:LysR family transcriptional regulator [Mesorhizobium xinjiangense]|uniref:LysR family transcriptional regulator n=1 Tax=Mesorhizobium xinjiangense TaxID=2678685 RepID=UPI0012EE7B7C|nr:LysR substrate-binding domain-containing protein [Mesorhizobium xinjiangense]